MSAFSGGGALKAKAFATGLRGRGGVTLCSSKTDSNPRGRNGVAFAASSVVAINDLRRCRANRSGASVRLAVERGGDSLLSGEATVGIAPGSGVRKQHEDDGEDGEDGAGLDGNVCASWPDSQAVVSSMPDCMRGTSWEAASESVSPYWNEARRSIATQRKWKASQEESVSNKTTVTKTRENQ